MANGRNTERDPVLEKQQNNPLAKVANVFAKIAEKWLPDAFVFAILLTAIAFIAGVLFTDSGPINMMRHWGDGMWGLFDLHCPDYHDLRIELCTGVDADRLQGA